MSNELTDRAFWSTYWESKSNIVTSIPKHYLFHEWIDTIVRTKNPETAIELGGFPGFYAIFLKKYYGVKSTLLDFFIHTPILHQLIAQNGLKNEDITVTETDLFEYAPRERYDLVISCGLIEHFKDTEDIIKRHVTLMSENGCLLITLPNFKGVNGWVQKTFDSNNYDKHVIACMDTLLLKEIAERLGLKNVTAQYFGGFSVWLENEAKQTRGVKYFVKLIWLAGKIFSKIVRFESKWLSPYIVLYGER